MRSAAFFLTSALLTLSLCSCTASPERIEFERGQKAERAKSFKLAVDHYSNVVDKWVSSDLALESAAAAAKIDCYDLKNFKDASRFYKHVVLYSKDAAARLEAQKHIAEISFEHLSDYEQAISEYQRLLELPHSKAEGSEYRLAIARSYFYRNDFYQSQVEISALLKEDDDPARVFDALLLRANILLTTKKLDEAIATLDELISRFPEKARQETIGLVLAVCYEEQKNYAKAIETLVSIKKDYPRKGFIDNRIRTLRERQAMLPGAHGLHK